MRKLAAALFAAVALCGASPPTPRAAVPPSSVVAYLAALARRDYGRAYALLAPDDQQYFRSAANFASVFEAGGVRIEHYRLAGVRRSGRNAVYLVAEHVAFTDYRTDTPHDGEASVLYGVVPDGRAGRVHDPGHPWRAFRSRRTSRSAELSVRVLEVACFERRIEIIVRFTDVGRRGVSVLPYGRALLTDDRGGVYRPIVTRDPRLTSRRLLEGIRLVPDSRYTGFMDFATPQLDGRARVFALRIEPVLEDEGTRPFGVTVAGISEQG